MDYEKLIAAAAKLNRPAYELAQDIYLLGPTNSFAGWEEESFRLISEVASFFVVSVRSVHFCGSAKLGFSPVKLHAFAAGKSDLDIAVIDANCFRRYHELVLVETKQLRFRNRFPATYNRVSEKMEPGFPSYRSYVAKGIFRPDLMPDIAEKREWLDFFRGLTDRYKARYKKISAAIYLSDISFRLKQADALNSFAEQKGYL